MSADARRGLVTFLIIGALMVMVVLGLWEAFPGWYLATSKHVLMNPYSITKIKGVVAVESDTVPNPDESQLREMQHNRVKLLYFDARRETRVASGLESLHMPLAVIKVGCCFDSHIRVGLVEFWAGDPPRQALLEKLALRIIYTAFRMAPDLDEVDVVALDAPDEPKRKGQIMMSVAARKSDLITDDPRASREDQLRHFGLLWVAPQVQ
ncbi:MAG: hypothetical protein ACYCW6_02295 [Candidatus Xenobia bacterium]